MSRTWKQTLTALLAGTLFGVGLVLGGMTQPRKVIAFLDFTGNWDPSLFFVMLGAVSVHFMAYRLIRGDSTPLFADAFALPSRRKIDVQLLGGAALFGVGWGLAGYCPGPAIVSLGSASASAIVFTATFVLGTFLGAKLERLRAPRPDQSPIESTAPATRA